MSNKVMLRSEYIVPQVQKVKDKDYYESLWKRVLGIMWETTDDDQVTNQLRDLIERVREDALSEGHKVLLVIDGEPSSTYQIDGFGVERVIVALAQMQKDYIKGD